MKARGKAVDDYKENVFADCSYMPCKKHPSSSSNGICAQCLKDRLVKLICSECGEQRLSSCSCSDFSSYRDSSCTADVGSVGRISFLMENEKPRKDDHKSNDVILLRRSSSSCVEVKKHKGFWKIKRLFKKKKEIKGSEKDGIFGDKNEVWVSDIVGVSRSRSLCSFRGGGGFNDTDEGSDYRFSSAKISDVTGGMFSDYDNNKNYGLHEIESRKSGVRGVFDESEPRKSGFIGVIDMSEPRNSGVSCLSSESEPRKSGFRGLADESEPRKSGYRGVFDASEPRNSGFSGLSYESEPRKSGFRGLSDEAEPRKSGFRGVFDEFSEARKSGYSCMSSESEPRKSGFRGLSDESEPRKSGFRGASEFEKESDFKNVKKGCPIEFGRTHSVPNMSVFSIKESDFSALDESAFIDLKLDSSSLDSKTEIPNPTVMKNKDLENKSLWHLKQNGVLGNGGSCRVTDNEKVLKRGSSSSSYNKVWKWLSRHYSGSRVARKKDEYGVGVKLDKSFV